MELFFFNPGNPQITLRIPLQGYDNLCKNRYHNCMETKNINNCDRSIFTLAQPITYEIKIAGHLGENWPDWLGKMDIHIEIESPGLSTTALIGTFDQAGLIGLLRQLYSRGYPLISVNCFQTDK